MLKGKAKDSIRKGILLVVLSLGLAFVSRNLVFNFVFGPHEVKLSTFETSGGLFDFRNIDVEADAMYLLPFTENVSMSPGAMGRGTGGEYTSARYWLLKSGGKGLVMEFFGTEDPGTDSSGTVFAPRFSGVLVPASDREGIETFLSKTTAEYKCRVSPFLLSRKADSGFHAVGAWVVFLLWLSFFLAGTTSILRGIIRLRQP